MKMLNDVITTDTRRREWTPLLESAAREVFELMLGCPLTAPATEERASLDTTAMVGLAGKLCGVMSLRCDSASAALMACKMLGIPPDKVGPDISDALGEVCNMVAGNFKNKISGLSEGCMLSVPTVITGSDYSLYSQADLPALEVSFLFEGAPITISLQIRS
jgi:chemotaxis protein CheX